MQIFFFDSLFYLSILLKRIAIFFAMWIELVFEIVVLQSNLFKISRKYEYMNINMKIFIFLVRLNLRSYRSIFYPFLISISNYKFWSTE